MCISPGSDQQCKRVAESCPGHRAVSKDLLAQNSGLTQHILQFNMVSLELITPDTQALGGVHMARIVIDKQHLIRPEPERLEGGGEDARIWLGYPEAR